MKRISVFGIIVLKETGAKNVNTPVPLATEENWVTKYWSSTWAADAAAP
jgi:hypothetical protein